MADSLKIEIDVSAAKAALDQLSGSFSTFQQTAEKATSGASTAVQRLNDAMKNIKGIDSGVLSSLATLNQAISNLNAGAIGTLNAALSALGSGSQSVSNAAQAVTALGSALNAVKTPEGLQRISVNFKAAGSAAQDADAHVKQFYKNQAQQATAAAKAAVAAQKEIERQTQRTQNQIKALGTELINASGFMQGLGVTAGKIVSILADLGKSGQTVGSVIAGLKEEFGNFGAAAAVVSGISVAFKTLSNAVTAVLQPLVSVGTQFQSFSNAIDAIDGKGAGAKTLEQLTQVAKETAQEVTVLTKNYTGFRAATEAAGLSSGESIKIYQQFSGALTALGQSSEQTEKALLALTQMFSKGKVQAEELRGQLGDALPGAFQFAAKSIGVSTAALDGMLKAGTVLATDLVPKLGEFLQLKFGDAVAKQAQTAIGQLKVFNTDIAVLTNAIAQGNLGGALAGVANGLREINKSLDSPALYEVAKAFGDLLGVLTSTILSTLGGIAQGFLTVFDAAASLAEGLGRLLKPIADVFNEWTGGLQIMKGVSDVAATLGKVIGALGLYYLATGGYAKGLSLIQTGLNALMKEGTAAARGLGINTVAVGKALQEAGAYAKTFAANLSFSSIKGALGAAASAVANFATNLVNGFRSGEISAVSLGRAIEASGIKARAAAAATAVWTGALNAAKMAMKGILIFALIEALTNLIPLLENVAGKFLEWVNSIGDAKDTLEGFEPSQQAVTESLQKFFDTAAETPKIIFEMSDSFGTLTRAQQDAKGALAELEGQLKGTQQAFKDSEAASRDAARGEQENADAIKQQIDAVNAAKSAAQERNATLRDLIQTAEQNLSASNKNNDANRETASSNRDVADSYKGYDQALKNLHESEKDLAYDARERNRRDQEYRDSLKQNQDAIKEQINSIKEWGVVLNDSGQQVANQLVALGETKKAAADYAYAFQQATKSNEELSNEIKQSLAQDKAKYEALTKIRDAIQKRAQATYDAVKASGAGTEAAEAATKADRERISSLDGTRAKIAQTAAADTLYNKIVYEGKDSRIALKEATQEMNEEYGVTIDQNKALNDALARTEDSVKGTKDSTDTANEASKSWSDTLKEVVGKLFSAGEGSAETATNVDKVTSSFNSSQKTLEAAGSSLTKISNAFTELTTSTSDLSNSLPEVGASLTDLSDVIPDFSENFSAVVDQFARLAESANSLAISMPTVQTSFEGINTSTTNGAEGLIGFVDALGRIPGMADGIVKTAEALSAFIDKIVSQQDAIAKAVTSVQDLAKSAASASEGFNAASKSGGEFIDQLSNIESAVRDLITAMNDLFKAAQKALQEAAKAKAAQSDSGGDSAGSGRYGGMSGNLPETQTVSPGAFGGAPAFKDGTANTSSFLSKVPGGGIPSILHPNEAVVPLPKGRKIPVDLKIQQMSSPSAELSKTNDMDFKPLQTSLTDVSKSLSDVADALKTPPQALPDAQIQMPVPQIKLEAPKVPTSAQLNTPPQGRDTVRSSPDGLTPTLDSRASNNGSGKTVEKHITQPINITIQTQDADSFKRSKDQVAKQLSDSIKKANRRIGN